MNKNIRDIIFGLTLLASATTITSCSTHSYKRYLDKDTITLSEENSDSSAVYTSSYTLKNGNVVRFHHNVIAHNWGTTTNNWEENELMVYTPQGLIEKYFCLDKNMRLIEAGNYINGKTLQQRFIQDNETKIDLEYYLHQIER